MLGNKLKRLQETKFLGKKLGILEGKKCLGEKNRTFVARNPYLVAHFLFLEKGKIQLLHSLLSRKQIIFLPEPNAHIPC